MTKDLDGSAPDWNDQAVDWYIRQYGEYPTNRLAVDALELRPDDAIVDVGCGTAAALRHAAATVTRGRLIGVDPVPRMLEAARARVAAHPAADRIELREGPAEALPVDDATADVVFAFDSIDHWQDILGGLEEVRRVLDPNGHLAIVKDGGLPGGRRARRVFLDVLTQSGFALSREEHLREGDVAMTLWVCSRVP